MLPARDDPPPKVGQARAQEVLEAWTRLRRIVEVRMDPRMRARIDPEDVLQDVLLDVVRNADPSPAACGFLWIRRAVLQTLTDLTRRHLDAQRRSLRAQVPLPEPSGGTHGHGDIRGTATAPVVKALRAERDQRLHQALESLEDRDREVLLLRHFEELSNQECAEVLGLHKAAAANRYVRALRRFHVVLSASSGWQSKG